MITPEARKQFDTTIGEMEDGIAQARKQLHGSGSSVMAQKLDG